MTALGELVLVLGLLVSAHCEVRARDPEVEEEEEEALGGRAGGRGAFPAPHHMRPHLGTTEAPPLGERARTGNWCAYVQKRVLTMAVACGTERYIIKSQRPCPSGIPDCQLVMYKVSSRPVYTQKPRISTVLHWACCKGHGGRDCADAVPDDPLDFESSGLSGGSEPEKQELRAAEVHAHPQPHGDLNREQNDHHSSVNQLHDASYPTERHDTADSTHDPDRAPSHKPTPPHAAKASHHQHHHHGNQQQLHPVGDEVDATVNVVAYPEATAALPVPHMMALVMLQLQPVLQGFNRSLEHLSQQVGDLARDVALLKGGQRGPELQPGPLDGPEQDEAAMQDLDTELDEVFQQISDIRTQMERQQTHMENRLHSQHAVLRHNLSSFKTDVDMKLTRHQKMLQVSLQDMNATLSELKLDRDQSPEDQLEHRVPAPSSPPPHQPQLADASALWEAIERLDNMVVNNTVQVSGLTEDMDVTSGNVQQLERDLEELREQVDQTGRNSQIQFMETGLEVEDAKVTVLRRVNELAANLTLQDKRLQEMDVDVDYLYTALYRNSSSGDCSCNTLKASVAWLERAVANVTELAAENRLGLDESSKGEAEQWGKANYYIHEVEALQHGLQQVKESLVSEQSRTRSLNHSLTQLSSSMTVGLDGVSGLKDTNRKLREETQFLSSAFNSLLKDAIRHSEVLELLLGEEVLEFLEWSEQDQEAHSIPALKRQLTDHSLKITSLLENRAAGRAEAPAADQPRSSARSPAPDEPTRSGGGLPARERQLLLLHPEHEGDGGGLWKLRKTVEDLGLKLLRLEERTRPCSNTSTEREAPPAGVDAELQAEVLWLKRGLEDHLSVFKNVFSNADVLAASDVTLDLDKLLELLRNKDEKKEKKRGGGREGRGGNRRSRRQAPSAGVAPDPAGPAEQTVLFVARSPPIVSHSSVPFEAPVNRGPFQPNTDPFTAPVDGIYLFILTLDLRPGSVHVVLRGSGGAQVSLHQTEVVEAGLVTSVGLLLLQEGEEVRLEQRRGTWTDTENNVFTGLLLQQTT